MIHAVDSQSLPVVVTIISPLLSVHFSKYRETKQISSENRDYYFCTVGLAEWIIEMTHIRLFLDERNKRVAIGQKITFLRGFPKTAKFQSLTQVFLTSFHSGILAYYSFFHLPEICIHMSVSWACCFYNRIGTP